MKPPTNYSPDSFHYYGVPHSTDELRAGYHTERELDEMWERFNEIQYEYAYRHRYDCLRIVGFVIGLLLGIGFVMLISL